MRLTEAECMREILSDLSKDELKSLFVALDESDDCNLGRVFRKCAYSAVTNYHAKSEDDYRDAAKVDAEIDLRLIGDSHG